MKATGFTLVEIMITVAVIAILTAIAVPEYGAYRNKQIRADAVRSLMKLSLELERCRSRNGDGTYTNCPNVGNVTVSPQGYYNITVVLNNVATTYTMTATKVGKADTDCNTLTLTHDGLRDANSGNTGLSTVKKRIQRCWGS